MQAEPEPEQETYGCWACSRRLAHHSSGHQARRALNAVMAATKKACRRQRRCSAGRCARARSPSRRYCSTSCSFNFHSADFADHEMVGSIVLCILLQ